MQQREVAIHNYVNAYNAFDINGMVAGFDDSIRFENSSNGEVNLTLVGLAAFRQQAEQARQLFSQRRQTIQSFTHRADQTEVEIDYYGVLAVDLPNGLKRGDELQLAGRSIFTFSGATIVALTDLS